MDGKPIRIENKNFAECMDLFGESGLFDFGAVFRALRDNPERQDTGTHIILSVEYTSALREYYSVSTST